MIGWTLALALAAAPRVAVDVLARDAPGVAAVSGAGRALSLAARGDMLLVDGAPAQPLSLPAARWRVETPGSPPRVYRAALEVRAHSGALRFRAGMALEDYVADVVASETLPGTPAAALEAQAVVVRSYALASRDRHAGGALCDLAHCQVLRGHGVPPRHAEAAAAAARATRGEVLRLPDGRIAAAPFHAACGGHTADPVEAFGSAASGAVAAADPGCESHAWSAVLSREELATALGASLGRSDPAAAAGAPAALDASALTVFHGRGGWSSRVADAGGGWRLSGDAFARSADAALGRGRVRSSRFSLSAHDGRLVVRGTGRGHGVGLCQEGAARRAAAGEDRYRILSRYFAARVAVMARSIESPVQK